METSLEGEERTRREREEIISYNEFSVNENLLQSLPRYILYMIN